VEFLIKHTKDLCFVSEDVDGWCIVEQGINGYDRAVDWVLYSTIEEAQNRIKLWEEFATIIS
jgi:hypothetical protein